MPDSGDYGPSCRQGHGLPAGRQAVALTQAEWTDAEVRAWRADLAVRLATIQEHPEQNLGHIEETLAEASKEMLRVLAQRAAQVKANTALCQCLKCHQELTHQRCLSRGINSRFGRFVLWRRYGWCPRCEVWQFPADHALGLARNAPASPTCRKSLPCWSLRCPRSRPWLWPSAWA